MSFFLTIAGLLVAGLSWLELLGLRTRSRSADLALAWFVGSTWFALACALVRFLALISVGRMAMLAIVLAPPVALVVARRVRKPAAHVGGTHDTARIPRRAWLLGPLALYVLLVLGATLLHGFNTPTHTDDGTRVRAFAPMLAFEDQWDPPARAIFVMAGAVPTFVPALAWRLTGNVDHFHVNYTILATLIALIVLTITLNSSRGRPAHGWLQAFTLLSLPLFVYHCTSTYSDALLAMYLASGFLFAMEFERTKERVDAALGLLLFAGAALVKREGEIVAAACAVILLAHLVLASRPESLRVSLRPALLAAPFFAAAMAKISAVGPFDAFPFLRLFVEGGTGSSSRDPAIVAAGTREVWAGFARALLDSGNAGMLFWVLPFAIGVRLLGRSRPSPLGPIAMLGVLFAMVTVSSLWLVPEFTLSGSTVHRALFVVECPAALWIAAELAEYMAGPRESPALVHGHRGAPGRGPRATTA